MHATPRMERGKIMQYDRLTLEILLESLAIPYDDEVIHLLNVPDEVLPPATFHFDTVLDSTAVENWKQSKKNIYETDAREVLESGRVDATEKRWKRLKCGFQHRTSSQLRQPVSGVCSARLLPYFPNSHSRSTCGSYRPVLMYCPC